MHQSSVANFHSPLGAGSLRLESIFVGPVPCFVLDRHPDPVTNEMVLWLKDRDTGEVRARRFDAAATFHASARYDPEALSALQAMLDEVPQVAHERVNRLKALDAEHGVAGARAHAGDVSQPGARGRRMGEHRAYDLYDVDLRLSHQFLLEQDLFRFANVRVNGHGVERIGEQWVIDYEPPTLSRAPS
jgi:hypothetical protein